MNIEEIYVSFVEMAESDSNNYNFKQVGIIEETLAFFGLHPSFEKHMPKEMHKENLKILYKFLKTATEEQLSLAIKIIDSRTMPYIKEKSSEMYNKVFIAMPMNENYGSLVGEIKESIEEALKKTNNTPYFVNNDLSPDYIPLKILSGINSCKFMISDFSENNNGVYYESGYSKGIGKTVIYCCKEELFNDPEKKPHFDVNQISFLLWKNKEDYVSKLVKTIKELRLQ